MCLYIYIEKITIICFKDVIPDVNSLLNDIWFIITNLAIKFDEYKYNKIIINFLKK